MCLLAVTTTPPCYEVGVLSSTITLETIQWVLDCSCQPHYSYYSLFLPILSQSMGPCTQKRLIRKGSCRRTEPTQSKRQRRRSASESAIHNSSLYLDRVD